MLIDPSDVTRYDRTDAELEAYLLFATVVAGKTASTQAKALDRFLKMEPANSPFASIRKMILKGTLTANLQESRLGQYNRLSRCFEMLALSDLDLRTCTAEDLEAVPGIGRKTSRFFIVHSRAGQDYAILDVHILRFLRQHLGYADAPLATPSSAKEYSFWEGVFVALARSLSLTVAELDLRIWMAGSEKDPSALEEFLSCAAAAQAT